MLLPTASRSTATIAGISMRRVAATTATATAAQRTAHSPSNVNVGTGVRAIHHNHKDNLLPAQSSSQVLAASVGGGGGGGGGPPLSYFAREQLPANTVVRFVPQQHAWIVERMGRFHRILEPGLAILIPVLDKIAYVQSLKEGAIEIPSQNAITADNVMLELDGVLYTRVFDPFKASYGVEDAGYAISQLAQTTMRSEIGQLTLDHVLKERTTLNINITRAINEAARDWGVVCLRYEIRDIHAPDGVVEAMHRQVTAERSKRAEILDSEGQRQAAINIAQGRKESVILASEALRAEQVNIASGEADATLLRARAMAKGIDSVAASISAGGADAQSAISLNVAEKYVEAFAGLARESTAVVVPGDVGDIGKMIANAMAVFGKINESQAKSTAKALLEKGNAAATPATATMKDEADAATTPANDGNAHNQPGDDSGNSRNNTQQQQVVKEILDGFDNSRTQ